jgi:hypothetical protein
VIELLTTYIRVKPDGYGESDAPADAAVIMRIIARVSAESSENDT